MRRSSLNLWIVLLGIIVVIWAISLGSARSADGIQYSTFVSEIADGRVKSLEIEDNKITGLLNDGSSFVTFTPAPPSTTTVDAWIDQGVQVRVVNASRQTPYLSVAIALGAVALIIGLLWYFSRSYRGGGGDNAFSFTRSRARVLAEAPKVTFRDVAGADEAKEELAEVVDFLKNPGKFYEIGARIPRGVLLIGPPGSGKTHIARAMAGEARVPFISASGSDFVEMFVGVGASRVRDLFETAKKNSPCIVFIDEIDAVGRRRGSGIGGGNDEREQTLNQLLVEMDGFEKETSVIVVAATNRPDVLDPALLRPGRFDRQTPLDAPDVKGRKQILRIHAKGKPMADDVSLIRIAKLTPGFVGADLENLLNESALLAARSGRKRISNQDLEEAIDRVLMGPARKSLVLSEQDKEITAYHESGHALAAHFLPYADPVHKITIVPRGRALGFMMPRQEDAVHWGKKRLIDQIAVSLGGRAAEEVIFDDITTGAENDFQQATGLARRMITEWGMHPDFGLVAYQTREDRYLGGLENRHYSEETAHRIDDAVQKLIDEQYQRVKTMLLQHREDLERVAKALIERETLDAEAFVAVVEGPNEAPSALEPERPPPSLRKRHPGGAAI